VKIYTRKGDDGTTGLLYGGRVSKDALPIEVNGAVDEAQAALGVARAETEPGSALDTEIASLERDLWILMAEVATAARNRSKLIPGVTMVTSEMVTRLEERIDELMETFEMPKEFVVPGEDRLAALIDVARVTVRRAERLALRLATVDPRIGDPPTLPGDSQVGPYLNRLSDLLWAMARAREAEAGGTLLARKGARAARGISRRSASKTIERDDG